MVILKATICKLMNLNIERLSSTEMANIFGGGDLTMSKTITTPDGKKVIITVTIKDDGTLVSLKEC